MQSFIFCAVFSQIEAGVQDGRTTKNRILFLF